MARKTRTKQKKRAAKEARESEGGKERERGKKKKNGQKLLMMASSSSDPGSWLIKPSYGMDGGWIGQRGCCCGPVGMCPGRGGVGNLGRNFSFVFAFVLRPLARKLRRTRRERGGGVMVSGADGRANYSPNTPR